MNKAIYVYFDKQIKTNSHTLGLVITCLIFGKAHIVKVALMGNTFSCNFFFTCKMYFIHIVPVNTGYNGMTCLWKCDESDDITFSAYLFIITTY